MGKTKRATRKELEEVVMKLIQETQQLRQGFTALDNYLGAYVKFKGDTITFNDYLQTEIEKMQKDIKTKTKNIESKDVKSVKEDRYKKISTPPL